MSEASYPLVFVRGVYVVRGRHRPRGPGRVRWYGRLDGALARPGTYRAWLRAVDPAGNRSRPTESVLIRVAGTADD